MSQDRAEIPGEGTVRFPVTPGSTERKLVFSENGSPVHFEIHSYERTTAEEQEEAKILEPDHPLLVKFQKTLKEHLERQVEHLRNEVFELETGARKKKAAREQLGLETYEAQQLVNKQQQELEMCVVELDHICSATEQLEFELEEIKTSNKQKRLELLEIEKKELHLRTEVESLNLLLFQMTEWENEVESELTINQRIFEKTKKDKSKLADEKRQLDTIIYKLMTDTWRVEEELQMMDMQVRVKEAEREKLAEHVAANNVNIETMNKEHSCIMHSWNSLIVVISYKDKHYNSVKRDFDVLNEKLLSMSCEIEQTKKLCRKQMRQNERLTNLKSSVQMDIDNSMRLLERETRKRNLLEAQMDSNQMLIDQIEKDIQKVSGDNINKSFELSTLVKEFEKISQQKVSVEEQVLKTLEEQLTNNKGAQYLKKLLSGIKEKRGDMEINLALVEKSNAKVVMDMEVQKLLHDDTQRFLDEMVKQQNAIEAGIKEWCTEMGKIRYEAIKKQREIGMLAKKIETAISKQGGLDVSPEEVKIISLQKLIADTKENIRELQKYWLREQGLIVSLSQQRQDQINDVNMIKKQMLLVVQKNLKINDELEGHSKLEQLANRRVHELQNRLIILSNELFKKKEDKDVLDKDNNFMQTEYVGKLKDSEMEILKIEAEMMDIDEDKVNLSDLLVECNREALTWEKKIKMAVSTKKDVDEERGQGGEVGNMKAEIHRMNVRFSQLKRAQNKLIQDLDHCISRRDAIVTLTEAREKKEKGGSEKTRINFTRKLDDMRNKVTQLESEVKTLEKKVEGLEEEEQRIIEEISMTKADNERTKEKTDEKREHVEEAKTLRQTNLQTLVLKQKKLKVYSELSKNRRPYILYKTESAINMERDKQKQLNNKLLNILENLLSDFPNHFQVLTRIHNTVKLPLIYL